MADAKEFKGSVPVAAAGARTTRPYTFDDGLMPRTPAPVLREPRAQVAAQVRLRYSSILDFHESQSLNISRTGMFVMTDQLAPVGSVVEFEFSLADGMSLLKGKGEVVRVVKQPVLGMGLRFKELDDESRRCVNRIVASNEQEGRASRLPMDFGSDDGFDSRPPTVTPAHAVHTLHGATRVQPGLSVRGHDLQVRLTPLTVGYFTNNPLINIRLGGFVIPIDEEVPLGSFFEVKISDNDGISLFSGRGKVVAKHERRIGVRLADTDRATLERLQAEVARLSPGGR
jgi:uncharacterized protein (TIGR02266 family)